MLVYEVYRINLGVDFIEYYENKIDNVFFIFKNFVV